MDIHALRQLVDPLLNSPFGQRLDLNGNDVIQLAVPYLAHREYGSHYTAIDMTIRQAVGGAVQLDTHYLPPAHSQQIAGSAKAVRGVKNIVAVGSGKGGVGKSTVATLIAHASKMLGARVGLLDADIYGPNQLRLMGAPVNIRLQVTDENRFVPMVLQDIPTVSFAGISDEHTPIVWRGPMISSAVQQLLLHTDWPELDLLVVDMPPGTGDIQLTLAKEVKIAAFVLVTTPQVLAIQEAAKTIAMLGKFGIPVAGYVENMGRFVCDTCQTEHRLFGPSSVGRFTQAVHQLGSLPVDYQLQDVHGRLVCNPDSSSGIEAVQIAEAVSLVLAKLTTGHSDTIIARELT